MRHRRRPRDMPSACARTQASQAARRCDGGAILAHALKRVLTAGRLAAPAGCGRGCASFRGAPAPRPPPAPRRTPQPSPHQRLRQAPAPHHPRPRHPRPSPSCPQAGAWPPLAPPARAERRPAPQSPAPQPRRPAPQSPAPQPRRPVPQSPASQPCWAARADPGASRPLLRSPRREQI